MGNTEATETVDNQSPNQAHNEQQESQSPVPVDALKVGDRRSSKSSHLLGLKLNKLLGVGAFSRVYQVSAYLAQSKNDISCSPSVECALKVIPHSLITNKEDWSQLLTERAVLATDCTPYATSLYATYSDDRYHYILMELAPNGSLKWLLRSMQDSTPSQPAASAAAEASSDDTEPTFTLKCPKPTDLDLNSLPLEFDRTPEPLLRNIASQLCRAVESMHQRGFLCRDIKPENILIAEDGSIKLSDFGLATALPANHNNDNDNDIDSRSVCAFSGTLAYLSPELLASEEGRHGAPHDWWAVGIVLYMAATFDFPFDVPVTEQKQLYQAIRDPTVLPQLDRLSSYSQECQDFIGSLLQKDPKRRLGGSKLLQHPWLSGHVEAESEDLSRSLAQLAHRFQRQQECHVDTTDLDDFQFRPGEADLTGQFLFIPFDQLPGQPSDTKNFSLAYRLPPFPGAAQLLQSPSFPAPSLPLEEILTERDASNARIEELLAQLAAKQREVEELQAIVSAQQLVINQQTAQIAELRCPNNEMDELYRT